MFFGAGNLIFPPFLGKSGGEDWVIGFLCFFLVEVLSCVGIYAAIHGGGSVQAMNKSVGAKPGVILNTAAILCTGVFIAPPRTAATTYEMAVRPLFDGLGLLPFSILFFVVVVLLTIRPSRLVDIIGKCLTPVLITGILILIVVGIANPIGPIGPAASPNIAQEGLLAGYQAMDILSVAGFAIIIQDSMVQSGLKTWKEQRPQVAGSTGVAALLLAVVYGGLTFLGATTSTAFGSGLDQAALIVAITQELLGQAGVVILAIVVTLACLTTSIFSSALALRRSSLSSGVSFVSGFLSAGFWSVAESPPDAVSVSYCSLPTRNPVSLSLTATLSSSSSVPRSKTSSSVLPVLLFP